MTALQRIAITVQRRKRLEQFELRAGLVRIGSGAHCDVRLAPDEAAPEQLLLDARADVLTLRNLSPTYPVRIEGVPLGVDSPAVIDCSARVEVGAVSLEIKRLEPERANDQARSRLRQVRRMALLIAVAVAYYAVLHDDPVTTAFDHSLPTPSLFDDQGAAPCPYRDATSARAFAAEQLAAADGKRERSPYSIRDGVLAVPLYDAAAACFTAAAERASADDAREARDQLAQRLQDDLRAHQVRLEWALERRRFAAAAQEVRVLRELLYGRRDPHAQWIAAVARELHAVTP